MLLELQDNEGKLPFRDRLRKIIMDLLGREFLCKIFGHNIYVDLTQGQKTYCIRCGDEFEDGGRSIKEKIERAERNS
jgi:hypothetical protein